MSEQVICPYCGKAAEFVSSREIYWRGDYGMVYACFPCKAWVGVHKGTTMPLGRLADSELRTWKMRAHANFDPLWCREVGTPRACYPGKVSRFHARKGAYRWLAERLEIPASECHIGMFDVDLCRRTVEVCRAVKALPREYFDAEFGRVAP